MTLRSKVITLLATVGILSAILMGGLQWVESTRQRHASIKKELSFQLQHLDFALTRLFEEAASDVLTLADNPVVRTRSDHDFTSFLEADEDTFEYHIGDVEARIIDILNGFQTHHAYVNSVYMGRANGSFVRSRKRARPTRYDPRQRPWYRLAEANPGKVMRTSPYRAVTTPDINIGFVTALTDAGGRVYGVVGADITLLNLTHYIENFHVGYGGRMLLIDGQGRILAARDPELRFKSVKGLYGLDLQAPFSAAAGNTLSVETASGRQYVYLHPSTEIGWTLAALLPAAEIEKAVRRDVVGNLVFFLAGLAVLFICALSGVSHYVLAPLRHLTQSARHIAQSGNLDYRVSFRSGDELGQLADAFNTMVNTIGATEKALDRHRTLLEARVRSRTEDLESTNRQLQQKIAEHKTAIDDLENSERRYRLLFENAREAILVAQAEYWHFANPAAETLFAASFDQLRAAPIGTFIHPEDRDLVLDRHRRRIAGEDLPEAYSFRIVDRHGQRKWVELKAVVIPWEQKPAILCFMTDITERVTASREIELQKAYLEQLFELSPEAIAMIDAGDRVTRINPEFIRLFGYDPEEVVGRSLDDVVIPERARAEGAQLKSRIITGEKLFHETVRQAKDGTLINVSVSGTAVVIENENAGVFAIYRDIRQRKEAETRLKAAKKAAEAASQAKSMFLASMSHEIRTPLNAILGFTQLLLKDPQIRPSQQQSLETVYKAGEHLLGLLNDILEVSKIEAGRIRMNPVSFDLLYLLSDLEAMFRILTAEKKLFFEVETAAGLPRTISTDEQKLRQVLNNLLGNAIKFTDAGGIVLRVATAASQAVADPSGDDVHRIVFTIEDTGPGIRAEACERIFSHFEQLTPGSQSKGGSGLGLAICKAYVTLMGGRIEVESRPGAGSIFRFDIPLVESMDPATPPVDHRSRVARLKSGSDNRRVLVADDHEANRQILVTMLEAIGFRVHAVGNGRDALDLLDAYKPHLVMMDMVMPVMDGFAAIAAIRKTPKGKAVPIIAVTASVLDEDRDRVFSAGADAMLRKPFRESELIELLSKYAPIEYSDPDETVRTPLRPSPAEPYRAGHKLPAELVAQLRDAAISLDVDRLAALVEVAAGHDPEAAERLRQLVTEFAFDALKDFLVS